MNRNRIISLVAGVIALIAVAAAGYYLYVRLNPVEQALKQMYDIPLVGPAIADHPEVQDQLRKAIREDRADPLPDGRLRTVQVTSDMRRDVIAPAVRGADDKSVIAAMTARAQLVRHLQEVDPTACREFSMGGISHPELLDAKGQQLFNNLLEAMEAAYRSGRGEKPKPILTRPEAGILLQNAGFTKMDFDRLNNFAILSNDVSCQMELKIDTIVEILPPEKRGPFARFIVAQ
ncbi:MAG: hypothetical protein JOY81_11040 [Alphaproteobacteria bacterium]|nr:hypothetical protein [Alphaproteobacteria bacterium]